MTGNVTVGTDAAFGACGVTIRGGVRGDGFRGVEIDDDTRVGGNVVLSGGTSRIQIIDAHIGGKVVLTANAGFDLIVADSEIGGTLTIVGNDADYTAVSDNVVGGNVQFHNDDGNSEITVNAIRGSLSCAENDPPPTVGGNTVSGRTSDQCANA